MSPRGDAGAATATPGAASARPAARSGGTAAIGAAIALASWAGAGAASSPPPPAFDEVLKLLAAHRHDHVRFTEVQYLAVLDRPLESSGELLYEAPDRLEKRTLRPKPETLLLEHGVLSARRGRHTYVLPVRDYPQVVPFIESIRATLAGERATLERWFHVEFGGEPGHWSLELAPREASLAGVVKDIRIEGERDAIRTVEIRQSDGDRSVLTVGAEVSP